MTNYIKNFVAGHGIKYDTSKRNVEALEKAPLRWKEIGSNLKLTSDSVVLFCGAKNNGKSSLVRYLVNKYNQQKEDVIQETDLDSMDADDVVDSRRKKDGKYAYYIDYDPGQPEMTTPGVVSAHVIRSNSQPLQKLTYLNISQHELIAMSCVGGTNMSVNPRMFIDNCRHILNVVKAHRDNQTRKRPIFINTMGHIRNVGLAMLMDLIKICQPTDLVVLNIQNDPMRTVYADLSPNSIQTTRASFYYETQHKSNQLNYRLHVHDLEFTFADTASIATKNRTALQLAYLASIPEALYKPIMQLSSKWLLLRSISVYCVSSYPLKSNIVLELLYHSWVHLVKLRKPIGQPDRTREQKSEDSEICTIIDDVGENDMLGCGIVADVDFEKRRLAIITPLDQETLNQEVTCLIKPLSIQVPREVIQSSESLSQ